MNVGEIIAELTNRRLIHKMPEEYIVRRKEREYLEFIEITYRFPQENWPEKPLESPNPNIEEYIWIPDGDIAFPEIDAERIGKEITEEGIEALAWYRSFHWDPPVGWGIYILDKGIYYIAENVFRMMNLVSPYGRSYNMLDLLQQGFRLLFIHEFFHYITDIAATTLEMGNLSVQSYYVQYVRNVYMRPRNRNEPIEEALANAFAFNRFQGWAVRRQLRFFMRNQPAGYSAFEEYTRKNDFTYGRRELGTCIRNGTHVTGVAPLETLFDVYRRDINFGDVPIYIVPTISDSKYMMKLVTSIPQSAWVQSTSFIEDRQQLPPDIFQKYKKTLRMLEYSVRHRGLKFEKIKGCDTVFTVRIDRNYRLSMRPLNGKWELLRIAKHDEVYRNPGV
ncbi:MAG: hypothetical protein ACP5LE_06660 [Thermoplasmata archaeon]